MRSRLKWALVALVAGFVAAYGATIFRPSSPCASGRKGPAIDVLLCGR